MRPDKSWLTMGMALLFAAVFSTAARAQQPRNVLPGRDYTPATTVIRPASTAGFRNYLAVPDGPCGCPMSVETDCYNDCPHRCRPFVFLHRVKRMFDCLLPCNLCCRPGCGGCGGGGCGGGGCGGAHGCFLGGRLFGGCGICCGGCGLQQPCNDCCTNPCGSAFAPTCGGHYTGCGCGAGGPAVSDPFIDDPLPAPQPVQRPAAIPVPPQAHRMHMQHAVPAGYQTQMFVPVQVRPAWQKAAYQTAKKQQVAALVETQVAVEEAPPANTARAKESGSVLRRVSVEQEIVEPKALFIDYPAPKPIAKAPVASATTAAEVPHNPLRK